MVKEYSQAVAQRSSQPLWRGSLETPLAPRPLLTVETLRLKQAGLSGTRQPWLSGQSGCSHPVVGSSLVFQESEALQPQPFRVDCVTGNRLPHISGPRALHLCHQAVPVLPLCSCDSNGVSPLGQLPHISNQAPWELSALGSTVHSPLSPCQLPEQSGQSTS